MQKEKKNKYVPKEEDESLQELYRLRDDKAKELESEKSQIKQFLRRNRITVPKELEKSSMGWGKAFILWLENVEITLLKRKTLDLMLEEYKWHRQRLLMLTQEIEELESSGK